MASIFEFMVPYIQSYWLSTQSNIKYSNFIAKFDFLGIYIQHYELCTSSNIKYGNAIAIFHLALSIYIQIYGIYIQIYICNIEYATLLSRQAPHKTPLMQGQGVMARASLALVHHPWMCFQSLREGLLPQQRGG